MLGPILQSLDFQSQALKLRAARQQVLAGNIVNADTPGYRAVDFDFAATLQRQTGSAAGAGDRSTTAAPSSALAPVTTRAGHMSLAALSGGADLVYRTPGQAAIDSNTVDLDLERAQFAENAIRYEATLRFVANDMKTLQAAMQNGSNG